MSCYHPIDCWRVPDSSAPSGHRIVFGSPGAPPERGAEPITIPCGKCIGCRLAHSRSWAVRCVHESTLHEHNCFLTLTFDDDHLPSDHSVHVRDVQLFLKRLRKSLGDTKVRFFACGEYGAKNDRPHYHLIIFGYDFSDDRVLLRQTAYGPLFISDPVMSDTWFTRHRNKFRITTGIMSRGIFTVNFFCHVPRHISTRLESNIADSVKAKRPQTKEMIRNK